jgi:hypothetical protein
LRQRDVPASLPGRWPHGQGRVSPREYQRQASAIQREAPTRIQEYVPGIRFLCDPYAAAAASDRPPGGIVQTKLLSGTELHAESIFASGRKAERQEIPESRPQAARPRAVAAAGKWKALEELGWHGCSPGSDRRPA